MKRLPVLLIAAFVLCAPSSVPAQDAMAPPPPDGPSPELIPSDDGTPPPGDFEPEMGRGRGPAHSGEMLDRWMERLSTRNPQEYERLQKLRAEDPEAFRHALHSRLREERAMAGLRDLPKLKEFIRSLSPEERDEVLRRFAAPPGGRGGPHGFQPGMNPEIRDLERETMELSKAYRESADAAQKEKIRTDLKTKLGALFDLRESERQAHVEQIEKDLANLKNSLTDRQARREEIIERRLTELTDGDALRW
jgi:hypothetical protein